MDDMMALIIGALAIIGTIGFVLYLLKSHKKAVEAHKRQLQLIEEQNERIRKERQERRARIDARYPPTSQTTFTPPTRTFVKREEVKPTYVPSATQSVTLHDNTATDMMVNMMIMDAVTRHHNNQPHFSGGSDPVDFPKVETPSKSSSSWGFDDSDSRASASSSFSSSSSDSSSSWSSSSSDSSSSSVSSDW